MAVYWRAGLLGRFTTGTWTGEIAYMGISGVAVDGGGDFQPTINQPLPTFDAKPDGTFTDDATYAIYGGSVGVGAWSLTHQRAIADALVAFATTLKTYQNAPFRWEEVRLSAFGPDNKVINGATVFQLKAPVAGTQANASAGPDRAIAVSWRSSGRGSRNRGRTYVPAPGAQVVSTDGTIVATARNAVGGAARTLHNAVNLIENIEHVVVSATHQTYSTISTVEVGDEFDVQSRRRRARPEAYTAY